MLYSEARPRLREVRLCRAARVGVQQSDPEHGEERRVLGGKLAHLPGVSVNIPQHGSLHIRASRLCVPCMYGPTVQCMHVACEGAAHPCRRDAREQVLPKERHAPSVKRGEVRIGRQPHRRRVVYVVEEDGAAGWRELVVVGPHAVVLVVGVDEAQVKRARSAELESPLDYPVEARAVNEAHVESVQEHCRVSVDVGCGHVDGIPAHRRPVVSGTAEVCSDGACAPRSVNADLYVCQRAAVGSRLDQCGSELRRILPQACPGRTDHVLGRVSVEPAVPCVIDEPNGTYRARQPGEVKKLRAIGREKSRHTGAQPSFRW